MLQSKGCFEENPQFLVSGPRKLKLKMTVVGIPVSLLDNEIIANIAEKSTDIKHLLNKGCTLELCFTKTKGDFKHAIMKMLAKIHSRHLKEMGRFMLALGDSVITVKDLVICHQNVPERKNHQPVHFVLATMNQELIPINHRLTVATVLPWESALVQLSILL